MTGSSESKIARTFLVELPKVFHAPAAAGQDDAVDPEPTGPAIEEFDPLGEFLGRAGALDGGGKNADVHPTPAAFQDLEEVVDRGPVGTRDHANAVDLTWDRLLVGRVEKPLGGQALLQGEKFLFQRAEAFELEGRNDELVVPAWGVNLDFALANDLQTVTQFDPLRPGAAPQNGRELGGFVLQKKVAVARAGLLQVGDLPGNTDLGKNCPEKVLDPDRDLGNGKSWGFGHL